MLCAKNSFVLTENQGVKYFTIPSFTATNLVTHGFSTRLGGVSSGEYHSLNLALHVNDQPAAVLENRRRICQALHIDYRRLVAGEQVHGDAVAVVTAEHIGRGSLSLDTAIPQTDALITNVPNVPLSSYYADCVPLFFMDPVKKAVGLAHAGWKGTVLRIGAKTVRQMQVNFGCRPQDILAAIGPSIGPCCYQVDQPVIKQVAANFDFWQQTAKQCDDEHWLLNLWEINRRVLTEVGVKPENITVAEICTMCRNDLLYSYRAAQGRTGRMASLIMLTG